MTGTTQALPCTCNHEKTSVIPTLTVLFMSPILPALAACGLMTEDGFREVLRGTMHTWHEHGGMGAKLKSALDYILSYAGDTLTIVFHILETGLQMGLSGDE